MTPTTSGRAAGIADRLWHAYVPYRRFRNTSGDLASMLAVLALARFVVSGEPDGEFVTRWHRAVAEAAIGVSPLIDLRAALRGAGRHPRFPLPNLPGLDVELLDEGKDLDDVPWVTGFVAALDNGPGEDDFPEIAELLLERHVHEGTFSAAEFHTPRAVAQLLVELASPRPSDRILDPACGSGGLLAATVRRIAEHSPVGDASVEAYATDRGNPRLAMLNLAVHGVDRPVVGAADPVSQFRDRGNPRVDRVLSNPPFNQRIEGVDGVGWPFGEPPASNANFAWLQLAWARLSTSGTAMMIMSQRAAWSNGREAEIRQEMIKRGAVLGVIALPKNLFADTAIAVHVWMLARDRTAHVPAGRENHVLFIDAERLGTQAPRQRRVLTEQDVERISSRVSEWRSGGTAGEPEFSRSVPQDEILAHEGNLDPRLYVHVDREPPAAARDMIGMLAELDSGERAASGSGAELRRSLAMYERLTRGTEHPRLPLRQVVLDGPRPGRLFAGPSGSRIRAEDYRDGGVPVVMPRDITGDGFTTAKIRYIAEQQAAGLERFRLRPGDVVIARRGELGRCAVVRADQDGWVCGTGCFVLSPPAELDADYFAACLRSQDTRQWLAARSTSTLNMQTMSLDVLGELPVVLPDLGTQQAIAAAMTRLDEHERRLRDQLALVTRIRRSALDGVLTG